MTSCTHMKRRDITTKKIFPILSFLLVLTFTYCFIRITYIQTNLIYDENNSNKRHVTIVPTLKLYIVGYVFYLYVICLVINVLRGDLFGFECPSAFGLISPVFVSAMISSIYEIRTHTQIPKPK